MQLLPAVNNNMSCSNNPVEIYLASGKSRDTTRFETSHATETHVGTLRWGARPPASVSPLSVKHHMIPGSGCLA